MTLMPEDTVKFREVAVVAIVGAVACAFFYTPVWAAGMSLLESVINDSTGYTGTYPLWDRSQTMYLSGFFPIWSDELELGYNWVAEWTGGLLYPLVMLTLPFEFSEVADIYLVSRVWLMLTFTYLFARRSMRMGHAPATLTACAFAFSGIAQLRLATIEMNVPWLIPVFLLSLTEIMIRPRVLWMIVCAVTVSLSLYSGHPIAAFYMCVMGGLWVIYLWLTGRASLKGALLLPGAGFISLFLSGLQFIPGLEALAWDWSYHFKSPLDGSYPAEGIFSLALPWLVGTNKSNLATTWLAPYMGAVPFLLFVYGLAVLRRLGRYAAFFAIYGIVFLGLAYALPPFLALGYIPPLDRLLNSASVYPTVTLAMAIIAGFALDHALRDPANSGKLLKWAVGAAISIIPIGIYAWWLIGSERAEPFFSNPTAAFESLKSQLIFGCAIFLAMAAAVAWIPRRKKVAAMSIVFLACFGLFVDALGWNHESLGLSRRLKTSLSVRYVQNRVHQDKTVITQCNFIDPNLQLTIGFRNFQNVAPLHPKRYMELLLRLHGINLENKRGRDSFIRIYEKQFFMPFPINHFGTPLADLLGLQFAIVCREPLPERHGPVFASDAAVYESASVVPGAFLTGRWRIEKDKQAVLEKMVSLKRGEENIAMFIADDPGVADARLPATFDDPAGEVEEIRHGWQDVKLRVSANKNSLLVLRGLYRPGWKAWLDGDEKRILPVDYLLRAITVPAGTREVAFKYVPPSFSIALWAFVTTVFFTLLMMTMRLIRFVLSREVTNRPA